MNKTQKKVIDYYKNPESRLGYTFLTWDTKHFGYYPSKKSDITERKAQQLMIDLVAKKLNLRKGDVILDAGCGRGTAACYLAQKYGANITGIDIVDFELRMAKKRARKLGLTNIVKFFLKDYSDTKFPNNYFDKVFTLETLVHSPNLLKTLKEFYRILKPGGRLVLFEYSKSPPSEFNSWEKKMIDVINQGSAMTSFEKMYHDTFVSHIKKADFKIISDEDITVHMLPSLERFYSYAKIPYQFIKFFHLQKYFINATAGVEFYKMTKKRLIRYRVFVAEKLNGRSYL